MRQASNTIFAISSLSGILMGSGALLVCLLVLVRPEASQGLGAIQRTLFWSLHVGAGIAAMFVASMLIRQSLLNQLSVLPSVILCGLLGTLLVTPLYLLVDQLWPAAAAEEIDDWLDTLGQSGIAGSMLAEFLEVLPWTMTAWLMINLPLLHQSLLRQSLLRQSLFNHSLFSGQMTVPLTDANQHPDHDPGITLENATNPLARTARNEPPPGRSTAVSLTLVQPSGSGQETAGASTADTSADTEITGQLDSVPQTHKDNSSANKDSSHRKSSNDELSITNKLTPEQVSTESKHPESSSTGPDTRGAANTAAIEPRFANTAKLQGEASTAVDFDTDVQSTVTEPDATNTTAQQSHQENSTPASDKNDVAGGFLQTLPGIFGSDIIAISSDLHYLNVFTLVGRTTVLGNLRDVASELQDTGLQVHRSHWVAHKHVDRIVNSGGQAACIMSNGLRVPVSRRRWKAVRQYYGRGVIQRS